MERREVEARRTLFPKTNGRTRKPVKKVCIQAEHTEDRKIWKQDLTKHHAGISDNVPEDTFAQDARNVCDSHIGNETGTVDLAAT